MESSAADRHRNHLHSESVPSIDLRLFSQSELFSVSLCSASSSLCHHRNDPDVSTLKIDRSVFNESAGGRKQTFSRIRLAPRNSSQFSSSGNSSIPYQTAEQTLDGDNPEIVALLKSLFGGNSDEVSNVEDNLVSVPLQYNGLVDCNGDAEMKQIEDSSVKKRKRGRPPKGESNSISKGNTYSFNQAIERSVIDANVKVESKEESVTINMNAAAVELDGSGNTEDPYARELMLRTIDMQTQEQLLEFLQGLDGKWVSNRKKRKIVSASALGDFLPSGWKIMLCMKNRGGYFWVDCRKYISPNGQQFMSCKDASSYLNSSVGLQDASRLNGGPRDDNIQMTETGPSGNAADHSLIVEKNEGTPVCCPGLPLSKSVQHEKNSTEAGILGLAEAVKEYKCHKCTLVFEKPDDLLQHLLSSHQRVPKRLRQETSNEEVIFNDGRYHCQLCEKSFEDRRRYNGHLGNHIKDYFKRTQASAGATRVQGSTIPSMVSVHSNVSAVEVDHDSGNSLLVASGNEVMFPMKKNEVLDGTPDNLVQDRSCDSNSHKPSYEYASAVESAIEESYFNIYPLVSSGSPWNATEVTVSDQYCIDQREQASGKGLLNNSNSVEDWCARTNSGSLFTGKVKEKLQVIRPRKNVAVTSFCSNGQTSENTMSDFMLKHDAERDLFRCSTDTSQSAHLSGGFTTYDLISDKVGDELLGEKFSNPSLEGFGSGNMGNMGHNVTSNHPEETKVFPDVTEPAQGLCSTAWLEKEPLPLPPKVASRRHVSAMCVWCKNEFHYEDFESETQIGPLNFACTACKANFSSDFNSL